VLDSTTVCQRRDDLAITTSARSVQGTTPTPNGLDLLPFPTTSPRRRSAGFRLSDLFR